ncbi:MAG: hypothetical protein ACJZ1O_03805 [Candidatus Neomarinimicrobiota bacterium]|nr:MAG: hypothetical protein EVA23_00575 [bacterium]|tara:strand:+ start:680 stop:1009 length:330 start_codon:yes stop_codon:yes gene_type:complete
MEILFLLIVLVVLFLAVFSSRKEQTSAADNRKDAFQKEKEEFAEEDIMTYGQVQQRREDLIGVLDNNLSDKPEQRDQIKRIVNDWADLKIKAFQDRRSWVRNPDKEKSN